MNRVFASTAKTRAEWHGVICWNRLADWAGNLQKGAHVEVEGELRYREYTPAESDRSVRTAKTYADSILALDRSAGPAPARLTPNLATCQSNDYIAGYRVQ